MKRVLNNYEKKALEKNQNAVIVLHMKKTGEHVSDFETVTGIIDYCLYGSDLFKITYLDIKNDMVTTVIYPLENLSKIEICDTEVSEFGVIS